MDPGRGDCRAGREPRMLPRCGPGLDEKDGKGVLTRLHTACWRLSAPKPSPAGNLPTASGSPGVARPGFVRASTASGLNHKLK